MKLAPSAQREQLRFDHCSISKCGQPSFRPILLGAMTIGCYLQLGDFWALGVLTTFFIMSLEIPLARIFARPIAAAKMARKYPDRFIRISASGLFVKGESIEATITWNRFKCLWELDDFLILVVSAEASAILPKQGMPDGARDFIVRAVLEATTV